MMNVINNTNVVSSESLSEHPGSSPEGDFQFFSDLLSDPKDNAAHADDMRKEEPVNILVLNSNRSLDGGLIKNPDAVSKPDSVEKLLELSTEKLLELSTQRLLEQPTEISLVSNLTVEASQDGDFSTDEEVLKVSAQIYYHWFASGSLVTPVQIHSNSSSFVIDNNLNSVSYGAQYPGGDAQQLVDVRSDFTRLMPKVTSQSALNQSVNVGKIISAGAAESSVAANYTRTANMQFLNAYQYEKTRISLVNNYDEQAVYVRDYYDGPTKHSEWRNVSSMVAQNKTIDVYLNGEKIR